VKIGIIEICEKGHYMVVNAVVKTYASDPNNKVYIFTTAEAADLIKAQDNTSAQIEYILMGEQESASDFLARTHAYQLDRIHLTTVTKYFKSFYHFKPANSCKIFFHFHNIELWFESSISIQAKRLWKVFSNYNKEVKIIRQLKYSLKDIWWDFYRKKFIKKVASDGTKLIILSEAQRFHLNKYLNASEAIIFPTLIFEPDQHQDLSVSNTKIRICIPGSVSQGRREYMKLLDILEAHTEYYSANFTIDLLGFIPQGEQALFARIKALKAAGLDILYYDYFIDVKQFDIELYKSDIILSNILIDDGKGMQTKETAAVYHMIRGAKPGIFPAGFTLDEDFKDTVVYFETYPLLHNVFVELQENRSRMQTLKAAAMQVSLRYAPESLLKRLV